MTIDELKQHIYRNTVSNYIFLVARLGLGLILFRLIYQHFNGPNTSETGFSEEFGFWALLWSVFGYGILLDFGFGFTAQKRVAELSVHRNWEQLSRVLSTILFSYVGIAFLLIGIGIVGSPYIIQILKITPANEAYFTKVLTIFFCGMGVAFPMGIFPEILKGQQRISLANYILLAGFIVSFALVLLCLKYDWGLHWLLIVTLAGGIGADAVCGYFALRTMPEVTIRPSLFSKNMVQDTMRFSIYAYITTLTTLILTRTDHLVISTALAVSAVTVYQAGAKVAEMFSGFALQIPETFSPAAAHLHAKGDKEQIRSLLINGTRFSVMIATPMYLICAFYMGDLLRLLTGEAKPHPETYWVGQVLLLWGYVTILTQSVSKRIFMMCGHERRLTWLGVGEALLNLGLSIGLIFYYRNVICVAIGSLVATFIFGWFMLWPWAAKEANISAWKLARTVLIPNWVASLPLLALLVFERSFRGPLLSESVPMFALEALLIFSIGMLFLWRFALNTEEREKFSAYIGRFFRKGAAA
jgi:O-antigen/teichoic acid export membrane protein